ncbi:transmembrane protein 183A isoform X2 [Scleropages formosus]|uniref:transmembrane protein 183A isoform X2 n=1 Tax=Scleropages formosus TaxID=113540 RepID=UPI0010FAAA2C|nr:transmembrane protein 183A isoform X2 [Scleropages formosus]
MPKKGNRKRLKFRAEDVCSESVTVSDYANSDPAIVRSGRVKKAVANAIAKEVKLLCGLEASGGPVRDVLSSARSDSGVTCVSSEDADPEDDVTETKGFRKKKNKRRKESQACSDGQEYPIDVWLLLASYIRPEDICTFALICKNAWTVTCTAAFWTRLYRSSRVSRSPSLPESTPTTLLNSKCLLFWVKKVDGNRPEPMWEFNFKFLKEPAKYKNGCGRVLQLPSQYVEVHSNPDSDCYLLQVTTLNFIFTSVVMGMTLTLFTINVSTDMRHHRVRLVFQDSPVLRGKKLRSEQGVQVVLDPVHSVRLIDWWHPQYPTSANT